MAKLVKKPWEPHTVDLVASLLLLLLVVLALAAVTRFYHGWFYPARPGPAVDEPLKTEDFYR